MLRGCKPHKVQIAKKGLVLSPEQKTKNLSFNYDLGRSAPPTPPKLSEYLVRRLDLVGWVGGAGVRLPTLPACVGL
jgi:hypothetical protein